MNKTNLEIAKECGAEVGTWDKSGNGGNVVCFSLKEFNEFVERIRDEPNELNNINAKLISDIFDLEWLKQDHFKLCEILNGIEDADLDFKENDSVNVKALKNYISFTDKKIKELAG